jgi:hypothetical protein
MLNHRAEELQRVHEYTELVSSSSSSSSSAAMRPPTATVGVAQMMDEKGIRLSDEYLLTICPKCKHGGHAACLRTWFFSSIKQQQQQQQQQQQSSKTIPAPASLTTCGVYGCECVCFV